MTASLIVTLPSDGVSRFDRTLQEKQIGAGEPLEAGQHELSISEGPGVLLRLADPAAGPVIVGLELAPGSTHNVIGDLWVNGSSENMVEVTSLDNGDDRQLLALHGRMKITLRRGGASAT